jgi:hypothetical protein
VGLTTVFARYGDLTLSQNVVSDYQVDDIHELIDIIQNLNDKPVPKK